jgi:hypothetical protein
MGNDRRDRYRPTHSETLAASDLIACILREVDTANAHVSDLGDAVAREDRKRCATIKATLHTAWSNAHGALTKLEQLSGQREVHARALIEQSEASARPTLDALWAFVTKSASR